MRTSGSDSQVRTRICLAVMLSAAVTATTTAAFAAAAPFRESFEAGAVGSKPTASNTAYDETIGSRGDGNGVQVAFAGTGRTGHSARFTNPTITSNAFGFLGKRVGEQKVIFLRRYYKIDTLPTYRTSVLLYKYGGGGNGQLGGTHNGSVAFGGTSQRHRFTLVNNNTNTTTSAAVVPVNAWFRVEVKLDFTSGRHVQTVRLFLGSRVDSATPSETLTGSVTGTYTDYVEDGILTNPGTHVNVYVDEAVNGTNWVGPLRT